ncbi:MAG: DEAD/DEAH box helicase, partial [Caldilineaceae bacterium]|nr:DEAD/DEAH box helicase [Caldilineaceae bacterium]
MTSAHQLQKQLPRTWPVFFARHGNFTPIQQQAIPSILAGENTLISAATAAGKTEAALAPLLERHLFGASKLGAGKPIGLTILYICPTRALVRDLYERLAHPLEFLAVSLSMKSGDTGPVSTSRPPVVLITTPESTDSLLTRSPRLFGTLHAIVLDEIHLFDHSPRGDHLRCLLRRIDTIRAYRQKELGQETVPPLQRIALSATLPDPHGVAQRYLVDRDQGKTPTLIHIPGTRQLDATLYAMVGLGDLVRALDLRAGGGIASRKSLVFCNTRNEVEQTAAYLREYLPFAAEVFVHYSNLDPALRRDVEDGFAAAAVAICVSTSTLELGIDIGSIDDIVLIGPPPTITSFLQRIGRGGRRTDRTQVLCLARSALEEVRFHALLALAAPSSNFSAANSAASSLPTYHFRLSVLVQQIFSMLKQSPTGGVRLADLQRVLPEPVAEEVLRDILGNLTLLGYLQPGRLGEWRAGPTLDELLDAHEIYSNIGA